MLSIHGHIKSNTLFRSPFHHLALSIQQLEVKKKTHLLLNNSKIIFAISNYYGYYNFFKKLL